MRDVEHASNRNSKWRGCRKLKLFPKAEQVIDMHLRYEEELFKFQLDKICENI